MDTQRLILLARSSPSPRLMLWQAWEREPQPAARAARSASPQAARPGGARRVHPAPPPHRRAAAACPAHRRRPRRRRPGRRSKSAPTSTSPTSTPSAATIARVALAQASRCEDPTQALSRAAAQRRAHVRRAGGADRRRPARTTARRTKPLPGPRDARARQRPLRGEAAGDRRQRRQGRAGADVPSRQLRDRRRVRRHEQRHGADHAGGVLPVHARHQAGRRATARWRRRRSSARSSTTRRTSSRRSTSARSTRRPPTRRASRRITQAPTTAGSA